MVLKDDIIKILENLSVPAIIQKKNKTIYKNRSAKTSNYNKSIFQKIKYPNFSVITYGNSSETIISEHLKKFNGIYAHHRIILRNNMPVNYEFLDVNDNFLKLFNKKRDEVVGKKVTELIPNIKKDSVNWIKKYGEVATKQTTLNLVTESKSLNKWFLINAFSPRKNEFVTLFLDVTKQKEAELEISNAHKNLKLEKENYEAMINNAPIPILLHDGEKVILGNTQVKKLFKAKENDDYIGYNIFKNIGSKSKEVVSKRLKNKSISKYPLITEEFRDFEGNKLFLRVSTSRINYNNKKVFLVMLNDMTKEISIKEVLKKHLRAETLLSMITSLFVKNSNILETVNDSLAIMGDVFDVSRVYVFEYRDNKFVDNTYEWCNKGIKAQKKNLQNLKKSDFKWWINKLEKDKIINYSDVLEIKNKSIRKMLKEQNIKSILVVPLEIENEYIGFLGFDECKTHITWSAEQANLMKSIGEIISAGIKRYRMEKELNKKISELETFQKLTINREMKMIELKKEILRLKN